MISKSDFFKGIFWMTLVITSAIQMTAIPEGSRHLSIWNYATYVVLITLGLLVLAINSRKKVKIARRNSKPETTEADR